MSESAYMAELTASGVNRVLDALDALEGARTPDALFDRASSVLQGFGFSAFILTRLPRPPAARAPDVMMNGWPQGWTDRYDEAGHYLSDPVARHCLAANAAFDWTEIPHEIMSARARRVADEATEFGLTRGLCVPIHTPLGIGGLSLAGSDFDPEPGLKRIASLLAFRISQALEEGMRREGEDRLTPRERDVLSWVAVGKTAGEIAIILSISEHTVGEHLKHVRRKLGTSNNAHSIVRALQTGQLRL